VCLVVRQATVHGRDLTDLLWHVGAHRDVEVAVDGVLRVKLAQQHLVITGVAAVLQKKTNALLPLLLSWFIQISMIIMRIIPLIIKHHNNTSNNLIY